MEMNLRWCGDSNCGKLVWTPGTGNTFAAFKELLDIFEQRSATTLLSDCREGDAEARRKLQEPKPVSTAPAASRGPAAAAERSFPGGAPTTASGRQSASGAPARVEAALGGKGGHPSSKDSQQIVQREDPWGPTDPWTDAAEKTRQTGIGKSKGRG